MSDPAATLPPLLQRLLQRPDCRLQADDALHGPADGEPPLALFFVGDPRHYPEVNDLAVVLPELLDAFAGRFRVAVVDAARCPGLRAACQVEALPSLAFVTRHGCLGRLERLHDWADYLRLIPPLLAAEAVPRPGIGLPPAATPPGARP